MSRSWANDRRTSVSSECAISVILGSTEVSAAVTLRASVTGGVMKGDRANLDIAGTHHDGHKIKGVVLMKKLGSDWWVIDQQFFGGE